ncbi:MAG: alpha/beta hydrolase [Chromatiaceae bacterium]|nr:alpha/beta hydrolase [Chromatiaceae bacterium]
MIRRLILLKTAMLLTACSTALPPDKTPQNISQPVNVSYSSLAGQAQSDSSIQIAYGDEPLQFGRLYLPAQRTYQFDMQTKLPLLVFVHGGCWLNAYDLNHATAFAQAMAAQGIAVWSVEYRRVGDEGGGWPGSLQDVEQALSFALHGLSGYPLDKNRVAIAGHSAGGQLALLTAANSKQVPFKAVLGLAAITDLTLYSAGSNGCQRATTGFIGGSATQFPGRYKLASPQGQPLAANTLLLHGSSDTIVPLSQTTQSGMAYKVVEGAGHFDWLHPQTAAFAAVLQQLQEQFAK